VPTITVEITPDDIDSVHSFCTGASVAERALLRMGLIGSVQSDRIRLYGKPADVWREVDTPGQLRRFMRLFDGGIEVPPPKITIDVPEGWQHPGHGAMGGELLKLSAIPRMGIVDGAV
jgi:hypothetical protein